MAIKFLNTVAVDTNVLYVDASSNRVGIGTTSSASLLEISQQLSAAATIDYPYTISSRDDGNSINQLGGEGVGIKFRIAGNAGTTPGDSLVGASIAAIRESSSDSDSSTGLGLFVTQNDETLDEAVRVDHDGNVGIGTTSPLVKLHVETTDSSTARFAYNGSNYQDLNWEGSNIVGGSHVFKIGGTEKMRIDSSGNVGIGITAPTGKLTVVSNNAYNSGGGLRLQSSNSADRTLLYFSTDHTNEVSTIQSYKDGTGAGVKSLLLNPQGGNVGIGETNPLVPLHISRDSASGENIALLLDNNNTTAGNEIGVLFRSMVGSTNTDFEIFGKANGANDMDLVFQSDGSNERVRFTGDGNVGIGTTSPLSQLTIGSNAITTKKPTVMIADGVAGGSLVIRGLSPILSFDRTGSNPENKILMDGVGLEFKTGSLDAEGDVDFKIKLDGKLQAPAYTQGFLQSDASGNIEISGGGTLPGGPYLPLSAGSSYPLTGDLYMPGFIYHVGDTDSYFGFGAPNVFDLVTGGSRKLYADSTAVYLYKSGSQKLRTTTEGITVTGNGIFTGSVSMGHTSNPANVLDVRGTGTLGRFQSSNQYVDVLFINSGTTNYLGFNNASFQVYLSGGAASDIVLNITETAATFRDDVIVKTALLSNQNNTDVDTGTEAIASVLIATYTAAFFDFVIKKGTNVRSGTVYACHDGTNVEFTETSTQDLGDTSDVTLNVVISTIYLQLQATTTSDDWSVKSLIRAI